MPEVAAHYREAGLVDAKGEVQVGHSDQAAFPVCKLRSSLKPHSSITIHQNYSCVGRRWWDWQWS